METRAAGRKQNQILNGNALKMIAMVTMFIDHVGAAVIEMGIIEAYRSGNSGISYETAMMFWRLDLLFRMIGRIAFPIYCFLLVEGFTHTGNVRRYGTRLLVFGLISEIPFDLAFFHSWCDTGHQNVFFTLLLGLIALWFLRRYEGCVWKQGAALLVCSGAAWVLKTDYDAYGVILIAFLYFIRRLPKSTRVIAGAVAMSYDGLSDPRFLTEALAIIPISMYNGERGRRWNKYLFYAFYPVHILALYLVSRLLVG